AEVIYISSQPAPVAGTNNTWVLGNLSATNITINITVLVLNISNNTLINNTANASCINETGGLLSVFGAENTTVIVPVVEVLYNFSNITITKTDYPDPVNASTNLTYQINISVTGNGTAYDVTVNETYPLEVIYRTSRPLPVSGKNNTWVLGNLTPGRNISINITVLVRNVTNGTIINNTANATFQNFTGGMFIYGAFAETTVLNPPRFNVSNISITKTGVPNPVAPGGQVNYTITVTSNGNGTAFNVTVNDTYPAEIVFNSAQPTPVSGTNNTFVLGNLTAGRIVRINITVIVPASVPDETVINNTVNVTWQNETGGMLSGYANASTNVSNVTPPVPPPPPSGGGGSGGSRGVVVEPITEQPPAPPCVENWVCEGWTTCRASSQSRECIDLNHCNSTRFIPQTTRSCTMPVTLPRREAPSGNATLPELKPEKQKPILTEMRIGSLVINFRQMMPWVILLTLLWIIVLTAYYVVTGHRKEKAKETIIVTPEKPKEEPKPEEKPKEQPMTEAKPKEPPKPKLKDQSIEMSELLRKLDRLDKKLKQADKAIKSIKR
ncbi:MAG: DUF11 domain-containing protein, partial [Candidatus Woesearchaeota archaeon]